MNNNVRPRTQNDGLENHVENNHVKNNTVVAAGLTKQYGKYTAVSGIDFSVPRGKCFGFLGPNGAGKTTTLRMILGVTPKSAGELRVFGLPVPACSREIRARIGVVPQADNLDPDFTVAENLQVYASYFGLGRQFNNEQIERLLKFASLEDRADAKTDTLSGGMKRRLTIARALINNPQMIILDEPTTGLDPQARHIIWSRLAELKQQGVTLLLTTHYMEEAERLCDTLVIMDHGEILDHGSPSELILRHVERDVIEIRGDNTKEFSLAEQNNCRLEPMGTSLYCYTNDPSYVLQQIQNNHGLTYLHRPADLEDVFLKLTGRELRD
ncbi:ATP-binding cassette domain-containing protein [Kaarinaea lacus]